MRIDPKDTSIHDLTPKEAADLRDLCERMLRGPVDYSHPLLVAWSDGCGFNDRQRTLAISTAFLPRALYALLTHGETKTWSAMQERAFAREWEGFR